jgi:hypothetical protein
MTPLCGEPEDGDFVGPDADKFGDTLRDGSQRNFRRGRSFRLQLAGETFKLRN